MRLPHFCATLAATLAATLLSAASAHAALLNVTSYDMPNGDGNASGGSFNYWDRNYTGLGSTTTDHAPLSGGLGKLTDGAFETNPWYTTSNLAGTGSFVGWRTDVTGIPTITFHFAGTPTVNALNLYVDNSGVGGVIAPATVLINGNPFGFSVSNISSSAQLLTVSGLSFTGSSITVTPQPGALPWIFISEAQFNGVASAVPEPSTWAMMLFGFAGLGMVASRKRRRMQIA